MVTTEKLRGKYIFVDFWSTYCIPCIKEFPHLKEVYSKFNREQLEILGVLDERNSSMTQALLKKHDVIWPNIKANSQGTEIKGYNVFSYPTTFLIDPNGLIIAINLRGEELLDKLKTLIVSN